MTSLVMDESKFNSGRLTQVLELPCYLVPRIFLEYGYFDLSYVEPLLIFLRHRVDKCKTYIEDV